MQITLNSHEILMLFAEIDFRTRDRNVSTQTAQILSTKIKLNLLTWAILQMYRSVHIFGKSVH
jgi:hypothetical protein